MNSVIICEGGTDLALIQYFMETVNLWEYKKDLKKTQIFKSYKNLFKDDDTLTIGEAGGCTNIKQCFAKIIDANKQSSNEKELYNNIVIISDRDEIGAVESFATKIKGILDNESVHYIEFIENNKWLNCSTINGRGLNVDFRILILIIPFEDTGALETFLLKAVSEKDSYDKVIIDKSNSFVDTIDPENKYLYHRRYITKAKFDVYFSVRTPLEQFGQRKDILKDIQWEEYEVIQESFKKLKELG